MFTGIITHIGLIQSIDISGDWTLVIEAPGVIRGLKIGASVSCSGVCLTVIQKDKKTFTVQVSQETLSCTTISGWNEGTKINLERALKAGDELGGHLVSGHVEGVAMLEKIDQAQDSKVLWFSAPSSLSAYIIPKGSVTLDGVSLTVNQVEDNRFSVNLIPHTLKCTTFGDRKISDQLNIETDMAVKYLTRRL